MKGAWVTFDTNFNINYLEVFLLNFFLKSRILYAADLWTKCFASFHMLIVSES